MSLLTKTAAAQRRGFRGCKRISIAFCWYTINTVIVPFEEKMRKGGAAALLEASRFFMKEGPVYESLRRIAAKLAELRIPYAVVGGMALVAHGYDRTTVDVDVLVTAQGLASVRQALEGLGYVAPFKQSTQLRDVQTSVRIEFLLSGQFPGDGKYKPVAFPDPDSVAVEIDGIRYAGLETLIQLKLASGMTHPGRLKDLADVQELIRVLHLPREFSQKLHPFVQSKFIELWDGVSASDA